MTKLTGLSLSFCVNDIVQGIVSESDVEKVVAGTAIPDVAARLDEVIDYYGKMYWYESPNAKALASRLFAQGKVEQPRLQGKEHPGFKDFNPRNRWIDAETGQILNVDDLRDAVAGAA